jgi:thiamine-monophosphate kinase
VRVGRVLPMVWCMRTISEVGEFGLIARVKRLAERSALSRSQVVIGIGDDAAVLRPKAGEDLVVSADTLVEGVHFRWETAGARVVGRRALVANLSDLAAMGARPLGFTAAVAAPGELSLECFDGMMKGLLHEAQVHRCPLIGGNMTRASEASVAITVLGAVARGKALRRDALRAGDRLFVTGRVGGAALAVARAELGRGSLRQVATPRIYAGRELARMPEVRACVDVSDGLAADLEHMLEASGLGADVDASRVPRARGLARACGERGIDPERLALTGGEDYELVFGLRGKATETTLSKRLGVMVTEFGRVTRKHGTRGWPGGEGWRHF